MFTDACSGCGTIRETKWKPKTTLCRSCARFLLPPKPKKVYTRTCIDCGDIAILKHKSVADRCSSCSAKRLGKEMSQKNVKVDVAKKRYTHICSACPDVIVRSAGRKSTYCSSCSRKHRHTIKPRVEYDFETNKMVGGNMRYFAVCSNCEASRQVTAAANSGIVDCRSCSKLENKGGRKLGSKDVRKRVLKNRLSKIPEPIYISGANKVNISIVKKPEVNEDDERSRKLVKEWLSRNKPTVLPERIVSENMIGQTSSMMNIAGW